VTVVASLTVAALFSPNEKGLQAVIDKRFYRRKHDAVGTIDAFSARLLDEVGLDAIVTELLAVLHETMQPVHASLWLRPGGSGDEVGMTSLSRPEQPIRDGDVSEIHGYASIPERCTRRC
jgi:hypothetical protein